MYNHIKIAVFLVTASFLFMLVGVMQNTLFLQTMARGNYFFENTRNNAYVKSIILEFPNKQVISFNQQDGLWRISEVDGYYADFSKIDSLIKLIRNTTIYRADKIEETDASKFVKNAISIKSIDIHDNIIDEALIAPKQDVNKFHYAMLNNNPVLYQLSGVITLSPLLMDWVQSPLLAIPYKQIKRIKTDNFQVYRRIPGAPMLNSETSEPVLHIQNLAQHFWYLSADDIKHALHFDRTRYNQSKVFSIVTFEGAIYQLTIFHNRQEYWLNIQLSREKIVSPAVINAIKENKMLYDGWYFKINPEVGEAIINFIL